MALERKEKKFSAAEEWSARKAVEQLQRWGRQGREDMINVKMLLGRPELGSSPVFGSCLAHKRRIEARDSIYSGSEVTSLFMKYT